MAFGLLIYILYYKYQAAYILIFGEQHILFFQPDVYGKPNIK